jgi:phosphoglycolate phosphatase
VTAGLFVFDLDGTLVDSLRDLADSANALLAECGARPLGADEIAAMVGEGAALLVSRAFAAARVPAPADALARFLRIYDGRLLEHTRPYDGMAAALDGLATHSTLAVLTNKPLTATRRILDGLNLSQFFEADAVLGGDGPLPRKPDPAGLAHLCARAGVAIEDTVMVGDSAIDWRTARNAGTRICLARYGFGFREFPRNELRGDEILLDRPGDLLGLMPRH